LKRLLTSRYQEVDLSPVEKRPESEAKRTPLAEDLASSHAEEDDDLLRAARAVIAEVRAHQPEVGAVVGVDLEQLDVGALRNQRGDI
jgi:hypothetical protein